jgi:hypothetical protein
VQNAKKALLDTVGGDTSRVITPSELRTLKQGIGRAAFSGDPMTPGTVRAQVTRDLYGPVNAHIERMADATPGVDVDAFKNANKDMSVLIPVSQALEQRAAKLAEGKESVLHRIKDMGERLAYGVPAAVGLHSVLPEGMGYALGAGVAGLGARAAARTVDYYLAQLVKAGETGPVPVSMLQEAVKAGVPAQTALAAARGQLHLPSLGGTPATAESSPLPPALHAAIQNGDHVAGKQALAQAVFGP